MTCAGRTRFRKPYDAATEDRQEASAQLRDPRARQRPDRPGRREHQQPGLHGPDHVQPGLLRHERAEIGAAPPDGGRHPVQPPADRTRRSVRQLAGSRRREVGRSCASPVRQIASGTAPASRRTVSARRTRSPEGGRPVRGNQGPTLHDKAAGSPKLTGDTSCSIGTAARWIGTTRHGSVQRGVVPVHRDIGWYYESVHRFSASYTSASRHRSAGSRHVRSNWLVAAFQRDVSPCFATMYRSSAT